ncbi:hypothetical protein BH10BAC2_BH10BAC2_09020 [soil metagenome]
MNRFYYYLILLYLPGLFVSCSGIEHDDASSAVTGNDKKQDSITYHIFSMPNNTYGFDIMVNGKTFIHQPVIPAKEGLNGFAAANTAASVAKLITSKLQSNNYRFLIKEYEIDSLLKNEQVAYGNTEIEIQTKIEETLAKNPFREDKNNDSIIKQLPPLPDAPVKNLWRKTGIVPFGQRSGGLSFCTGNFIFIGGGELKDETTNDFWGFNTITDAWTCFAFMPGGRRRSPVSFAINGSGYISLGAAKGGDPNNFKKDLYAYDPDKNTWTEKASFPGAARVDASSFTINDKAYIGSGYTTTYCSDFYEYDPSKDKWTRIADFGGGPVSSSIGISTGTKGFLIAGDRVPENKKFVYEYLPVADNWEKRKDFPGHARYFLNGWGIDTNFFIAGVGGAEGGALRFRDFFLYDVSKDNWTSIPDYPTSKAGNSRPCGGNVNGKIYSGTGFDGGFLNDWNVYEYYFSVRTDTGLYDESVCYPLKYDGKWQLYQECIGDNCYAGPAIKSSEQLGNICYSSRLLNINEKLSLQSGNGASVNYILLPRRFNISAEKLLHKPVGLRLFFTRDEIEKFAADFEKITHTKISADKIKILQYNSPEQDLQPGNNNTAINNYTIISPQLYGYGFKQQTLVASFNVTGLSSEFYVALQLP